MTGTIGPGHLILVVGPSGAGKDTLINGARTELANDPAFVFPRRVITRPASDFEDHETIDAATFERSINDGTFALWWRAHGHGYGIPASIDDDIRRGRTVVCNVSRTIVDQARQRYGFITVVSITAPEETVQARLVSRQRSGDGELARRIARSAEVERLFEPDTVIENIGKPEAGISRLLQVIRCNAGREVNSGETFPQGGGDTLGAQHDDENDDEQQ